jgi:ubiquinone/menaquinone biosynthesis C-methylase UbiE
MDAAEFDRFAEEYRQLHANNIRLSGEGPEYFAEYKVADVAALLAAGGFPAEPAILDFGAGVGTSVAHFRKHVPRCSLTCLDISNKSLEIGRATFAGEANFVHFDGTQLPFPDNCFDLVFVACVLHHIAHAEHAHFLEEFHRVIRPGGGLVIFEHNPYNPLTVHAVNTCPFDENAVLLKPRRLAAAVRAARFADCMLRYRIFFPHALRSLRRLEKSLKWLPIGAQYYVYARKS